MNRYACVVRSEEEGRKLREYYSGEYEVAAYWVRFPDGNEESKEPGDTFMLEKRIY